MTTPGNETSEFMRATCDEHIPSVRYSTGLSDYTEQLVRGRFAAHHHSTTGRVKYTQENDALLEAMAGRRPVEAFRLQIDGHSLSSHWRWMGMEELPAPEEGRATCHVVVRLAHTIRPIEVRVHTVLDGTPFMVRWLEMTNTGSQPAALASVAPWSGLLWYVADAQRRLPAGKQVFTLGHYAQHDFGHEGDLAWHPLPPGTTQYRGEMGRSGWGLPFFIVRNEATGEAVMAHLAWSGNWKMEFHVDTAWPVEHSVFPREGPPRNTALYFSFEPDATAPQRILAPGETITSPAVHLAFMRGDLPSCVHALHTHLRQSVFTAQPDQRGLLVGAGRVVAGDAAWLRREIDMASAAGCEYFVVDAGWYGAKPDSWWTTVGDWNVGHWLPADGLAGIRAYVHEKGMLFGLWMEPEAIGSDSRLLREHPAWVLQRDGQPVAQGRVLDSSQPEVARWVEGEITRVIQEHQVDVFKLDYNTWIDTGGQHSSDDGIENTLWRHYEALYAIVDRLRQRFPHVSLENCAAGGGRNDIGLASKFHISCQSDWTVPPRSLKALNNLTVALPPEQLRYYFGHIAGYHEYGDLDFQLRVPLFGNPIFVGFAPNAEGIDGPVLERLQHYVTLYKSFMRPILPTCRVFHHTPALELASTPAWCVLEYASADATRAYTGIFRLDGGDDPVYHLYPRGLDPRRSYRITWDTGGITYEESGKTLLRDGLAVRLESPLTSELILFESL